jgi:hypothetical protein
MIAAEQIIIRPTYGLFRCTYCADDGAVDSDGHEHDGLCGDREWPDELPRFSSTLKMPANELPIERMPEALSWVKDLDDDVLLVDLGLLTNHLDHADDHYPTCPCCGRRAELIAPLLLAA